MKKLVLLLPILIIVILISKVLTRSVTVNNEANQRQDSPFPTGIFPKDYIWKDQNCIYYYDDGQITNYCINGNSNRISTIKEQYQNYFQRHIKLGESNICDTYNFIITEPDQIATKIIIYDNIPGTSNITLESNLTVRVDKCENPLTLSNALPTLESKYYIWNHTDEFPIESETYPNSIEITNKEDITSLHDGEYLLLSFQSVANFVHSIPNQNKTKFGLIDSYGELWIVEK